jgi:hypothetical protein
MIAELAEQKSAQHLQKEKNSLFCNGDEESTMIVHAQDNLCSNRLMILSEPFPCSLE